VLIFLVNWTALVLMFLDNWTASVLIFLDNSQLDTPEKPVELLCTNDQFVAKAASYTTHNIHQRLGPAIPEIKQLQCHALDGTATGIDSKRVPKSHD
jgi:hypothetical protein